MSSAVGGSERGLGWNPFTRNEAAAGSLAEAFDAATAPGRRWIRAWLSGARGLKRERGLNAPCECSRAEVQWFGRPWGGTRWPFLSSPEKPGQCRAVETAGI